MPQNLPRPHESLQISEPCSVEWGTMSGDKRERFCAHCQKHVHNLSELTPREAFDLVLRSDGRLCLRIERDPLGLPRTRTLVEPLYQIGRRASRLTASAFGAVLALGSAAAASAQTNAPAPAQQTVTTSTDATKVEPAADPVPEATPAELPVQERMSTLSGMIALTPSVSEPLVKAAMDNDLETVRRLLLFEGADVNVLDKSYGTTALTHAFMNGNREMMRELIWRGARVNDRLAYKQTALMRLREATTVEAVRDLLDAKAKVNLRDEDGNTALMFAAEQGRADVVELLLRAGAKVNAQNNEGQTPLMKAASADAKEAARLLLQAGADYSRRDAEGHTALWHARDNDSGDTAALLLAYGAFDEPKEPEEKREP